MCLETFVVYHYHVENNLTRVDTKMCDVVSGVQPHRIRICCSLVFMLAGLGYTGITYLTEQILLILNDNFTLCGVLTMIIKHLKQGN